VQKFTYIIWLVGSGVWWVNAALALHGGHRLRALGSLCIALVFFAYGMWTARAASPQSRTPRR
jgi:hypothetical protein